MEFSRLLLLVLQCEVIFAVLPSVHYEVTEEQPSSTFVGNIVTDAELATNLGTAVIRDLRYRITDANVAANIFVIDSVTGILRTRIVLDREGLCQVPSDTACILSFDVAATRSNPDFYDVVTVTVVVLDVNDMAPTFPMPVYDLEIPESATPPVLYNLPLATDLDSPSNSVKRYVLASAFDNFQLNVIESDGAIRAVQLRLIKKVDREMQDSYEVTVTAEDGGSPAKSGRLTINITVADANDNAPIFVQDSYMISVAEDTAVGSTVLRVRANDKDIGVNGRVHYSLAPASETFSKLFLVDSNTGDIILRQPLDFETTPTYHLIVQAQDGGVNPQQNYTDVTIHVTDVNDQAPSITINTLAGTSRAEVSESAKPGQFVAHVSVKDSDTGAGGNFSCYSDNDQFQLRSVAAGRFELKTATNLDRETQETIVVGVVCTDMGSPPLSSSKQLTVVVQDENDNPPVFSQTSYHQEIAENNQVNDVILQVNATDADLGQNAELTFSIVNGKDVVTIDNRGLVRANAVFDYETEHEVVFVVKATDSGTPALSATVSVVLIIKDSNDEPPRFLQNLFMFSVYENQAVGAEVGTVTATDADSAPFDQIEYSLSQTEDMFSIDTLAGTIRAKVPLDRESGQSYTIHVTATNVNVIPPLSSSAAVQIDILDVNDNAPVIAFPNISNHSVSISNQVPEGHRVTVIRASDADMGENARLHFAVITGNTDGYFEIDRQTGILTTAKSLSDIDLRIFSMTISVSDGGFPPLGSEAVLQVMVNKSLGYEDHKTLLSGTNVTIVIALSVASAVIVIILLAAIIVVKARDVRQRRHKARPFRYSIEYEKNHAKQVPVTGVNGVNETVTSDKLSPTKDSNMFANNQTGRQRSSLASYQQQQPDIQGLQMEQRNSWPKLHSPDKPPLPPKQRKIDETANNRALSAAGLQIFGKRPSQRSTREEHDSDSAYSGDMSNTDSGRGPSEDPNDSNQVFSHSPCGMGKPPCEPIYTRPLNRLPPRIQYQNGQTIPEMIANNDHLCVPSKLSRHSSLPAHRPWNPTYPDTNTLSSVRSWESLPEDDGGSTTSGSYVVDLADLEDVDNLNYSVAV